MLHLDLFESHEPPDFIVVQALPPGTVVDRYRLHEAVSEDACGIVYRAEDLELNCQVAVKEHLPHRIASRVGEREVKPRNDALAAEFEAGVQTFTEDAHLLAALRIPSIVAVSRTWQAGGTAYRAMPWLEGETLASRLAARTVPSGHLLQQKVLEPLLEALLALHMRRHVHRRITTDTVFFTSDSRVILLGFSMLPDSTCSGPDTHDAFTSIELTPSLRPKIGASPIGPWSDIYSLGALMHLLVRGALPSTASSRLMRDDYRLLGSMPELEYPVDLLRAIDWALTVLPEKRPRDITQFRKRLRAEKRNSGAAARQFGAFIASSPDEILLREVEGGSLPQKTAPPAPPVQPAQNEPEPANPEPAATPPHAVEQTTPSQSAFAPGTIAAPPAPRAPAPPKRPMPRGRWIAGASIAAIVALIALAGWWLLEPWLYLSFESAAPEVAVRQPATASATTTATATAASSSAKSLAAATAPKVDSVAATAAPVKAESSAAEVSSPPFDLPQVRAAVVPAPLRNPASASAPVRVSRAPTPSSHPPAQEHTATPVPARKATDRRCGELLSRLSLGDGVASKNSLHQKCQ